MRQLVLQSDTIHQYLNQMRQRNNQYHISDPHYEPIATIGCADHDERPNKSLLMANFLDDTAVAQQQCASTDDFKIRPARPADDKENVPQVRRNSIRRVKQPKHLPASNLSDDELFLLITDSSAEDQHRTTRQRQSRAGSDDSGVHIEYRQYVLNRKLQLSAEAAALANRQQHDGEMQPPQTSETMITDRLMQLRRTPTKKQQRRRRQCRNEQRESNAVRFSVCGLGGGGATTKNVLQSPPFQPAAAPSSASACSSLSSYSSHRNGNGVRAALRISRELAARLRHINQLLQYEQSLLEALAHRRRQFREQNGAAYDTRPTASSLAAVVATDFGRIQARLAKYAQDIVQSECELFAVQREIADHCCVVHNLKRMQRTQAAHIRHLTVDNRDEDLVDDDGDEPHCWRMSGAVADRIATENRHQQAPECFEEFVDRTFVDGQFDKNKSIIV